MALQQAERYGTPLGQTLRVMAQENRDMRMNEAEKKAAGLPPKLTVPMILFFLPVLFVVILGPAGIRVSQLLLSGRRLAIATARNFIFPVHWAAPRPTLDPAAGSRSRSLSSVIG